MQLIDPDNRPGLLVSVRSADEALAALAGGADIIDVKEPDRGPLGAADVSTIAAVVRAVNGRAPVTAAAGELVDLLNANSSAMPPGVSLLKIGLAGCRAIPDWPSQWRGTFASLIPSPNASKQAVAVAYADWRAADAPQPDAVLQAAIQFGCPALLIDTWDKSNGSLFDHWPSAELSAFTETARSHQLTVVLAGSLAGESFTEATRLRPDFVAVRSAACDAGRGGTLSCDRVRTLRQSVLATRTRLSHPEALGRI